MDRSRPTRRDLLRAGLLGGLSWTFGPRLLAPAWGDQKSYTSREGPARGVIQIFLPGGLAHQDSFDPKPHAPLEYRGKTRAIGTRLDGLQVSSLLKETAKVADQLVVCRSLTHNEAAHERGVHNVFTGYRPSPALTFPSFGSVVDHELGPRGGLPAYVCVPNVPTPFAGPGYLSTAHAPFALGSDPAKKDFKVRDLDLPEGVDRERFERRRELLELVDGPFREREHDDAIAASDAFYRQAYALLDDPAARAAFDLSQEPEALKKEYGEHEAGQRFLLARRLVEAGVRYVVVSYGGWDHHDEIYPKLEQQLPKFDQAFAALIRDLRARGLLDSTLVLVTSEFGRTPKINQTGGRDHWPKVFSNVMAGAGLRRGLVYGSSDATASEPDDDPLSVMDWATTVYQQLGIVADKELLAPGLRPVEIVKDGRVIQELLS